jgi:hypothetical protein
MQIARTPAKGWEEQHPAFVGTRLDLEERDPLGITARTARQFPIDPHLCQPN